MNDLWAAARTARDAAYAPYSRFPVGAALRTDSGRIFAGANVENAAYPQGQCAEASALGAMVTAGERRVVEVLVVGSGPEPCAPCGGCRQRLNEFAAPATVVHLAGTGGAVMTTTLGELLPRAFGPRDLGTTSVVAASIAAMLHERAPGFTPAVGLILGSGLGEIADAITPEAVIDYRDLPAFPLPTVSGHAGRLVLGRLGGVPVACLQGRVHLYEGRPAGDVARVVGAIAEMGCRVLVLTNAAGSLRPEVGPGALVMLSDHINFQGTNPLVGAARFVDLSAVYDPALRAVLREAAAAAAVALGEGVYLAVLGPCFETPAEIRAYRALGADLVGMSTVPEAIAARAVGLRVAAISVVTNLAAGMSGDALSHHETLQQSSRAAAALRRLLEAAMPGLARAAP
jgi:homotetrameric cytidine deaminase